MQSLEDSCRSGQSQSEVESSDPIQLDRCGSEGYSCGIKAALVAAVVFLVAAQTLTSLIAALFFGADVTRRSGYEP